jgi:glyoxylase-like metal-dependent hydrolase (beta-lactamase superfamily II)
LYRVQDENDFTVFLVTPDGIILADPLSLATSVWLKGELETRFPGQPVRYVVYTHHAFDRAAGASVFQSTAEVVAHGNFTEERMKAEKVLPASLAGLDSNDDGVLNAAEIAADPFPPVPPLRDRDGDGILTPAELYFDVWLVDSTYTSRRMITLGGKSVELIHPGDAYAADMTLLHFPAERMVFAAGYPPLSSRPFSFAGSRPTAVLASMRAVASIDFDGFVSGDGSVGTRADFAALSRYVEDLVTGVSAGFASRLTLDELQSTLMLADHQGTPQYGQRTSNIAEAYARLRSLTTNLYGVAHLNRMQRGPTCTQIAFPCDDDAIGGSSLMGTVGMSVSVGRVGILAESNIGGRFIGHRRSVSTIYEYLSEYRDRLTSFLARYDVVRGQSVTIGLAGGVSLVSEAERATEITRPSPLTGPGRFSSHTSHVFAWGQTLGIEAVIPLGDRIGMLAPVRLTHTTVTNTLIGTGRPTGHWNLHAGVGLALMFRGAY